MCDVELCVTLRCVWRENVCDLDRTCVTCDMHRGYEEVCGAWRSVASRFDSACVRVIFVLRGCVRVLETCDIGMCGVKVGMCLIRCE